MMLVVLLAPTSTKKIKEFKKHKKFLADKVIASDLGIKKTVNDKTLKHKANT